MAKERRKPKSAKALGNVNERDPSRPSMLSSLLGFGAPLARKRTSRKSYVRSEAHVADPCSFVWLRLALHQRLEALATAILPLHFDLGAQALERARIIREPLRKAQEEGSTDEVTDGDWL